jgi:hypothetical protein
VQFLFQAPVTRRQLVHYKLLRAQLAILISSAIATLFLRPGSLVTGWTLMAGLWVVMMTMRLHLMGVALRRASLGSHGASGFARQWLPLAVLGAPACWRRRHPRGRLRRWRQHASPHRCSGCQRGAAG